MVTQKTAERIWNAHREIQTAEKLLEDIAEVRARLDERGETRKEARLRDAFGNRSRMQLAVPSGDDSRRLFDVFEKLAESIIRAHIADKQRDLVEANEQARIELDQEQAKKA